VIIWDLTQLAKKGLTVLEKVGWKEGHRWKVMSFIRKTLIWQGCFCKADGKCQGIMVECSDSFGRLMSWKSIFFSCLLAVVKSFLLFVWFFFLFFCFLCLFTVFLIPLWVFLGFFFLLFIYLYFLFSFFLKLLWFLFCFVLLIFFLTFYFSFYFLDFFFISIFFLNFEIGINQCWINKNWKLRMK